MKWMEDVDNLILHFFPAAFFANAGKTGAAIPAAAPTPITFKKLRRV
jgi:hypothetical protein